jgi:hypothetical protein
MKNWNHYNWILCNIYGKWFSTPSIAYVIFVIRQNNKLLKRFQHSEKIITIEHSTPNGKGYF